MQSGGGGRLFAPSAHPSQGEIKAARVSSLIDRSVPDVWPGLSLLGETDFCVPSRYQVRGRVMKDVGSVLLSDPNGQLSRQWMWKLDGAEKILLYIYMQMDKSV